MPTHDTDDLAAGPGSAPPYLVSCSTLSGQGTTNTTGWVLGARKLAFMKDNDPGILDVMCNCAHGGLVEVCVSNTVVFQPEAWLGDDRTAVIQDRLLSEPDTCAQLCYPVPSFVVRRLAEFCDGLGAVKSY